jgi:hypothetical protein
MKLYIDIVYEFLYRKSLEKRTLPKMARFKSITTVCFTVIQTLINL